MRRYLYLFVHCAVVAVPKADHIVSAASNYQVLIGYVDASYVTFVRAVNLLAGYEFVTLLRLRQSKECNTSLPTRCYEPKTCLVTSEGNICDFLLQIKRLVSFLVVYYYTAV